MHEVEDLFEGMPCKTRLWVSPEALQGISDYLAKRPDEQGPLMKKLRYWTQAGFVHQEGVGEPIKHEWDGAYRIGWGLFRIVGFYEDETKANFIAVDAFLKKKQKLSGPERARIDEVARVKRDGDWKRKQPDGYPRLAPGT
jgi:hypothetical protein